MTRARNRDEPGATIPQKIGHIQRLHDVIQHHHWLTRDGCLGKVEGHRHQHPPAQEQQLARVQQQRVHGVFEQHGQRTGVQIQEHQLRGAGVPRHSGMQEHCFAAGQHLRLCQAGKLSRIASARHNELWLSALGSHPIKPVRAAVDDGVIIPPAGAIGELCKCSYCTEKKPGIGDDGLALASGNSHPPQTRSGEIADPLTIGREEGGRPILSARHCFCLELIQAAQVQTRGHAVVGARLHGGVGQQ